MEPPSAPVDEIVPVFPLPQLTFAFEMSDKLSVDVWIGGGIIGWSLDPVDAWWWARSICCMSLPAVLTYLTAEEELFESSEFKTFKLFVGILDPAPRRVECITLCPCPGCPWLIELVVSAMVLLSLAASVIEVELWLPLESLRRPSDVSTLRLLALAMEVDEENKINMTTTCTGLKRAKA